MEPTTQQPILVLGGTGKTGRRVTQRLRAQGRPVRIGTPSRTPAFDWNDPATWPSALDGVGAVYLAYYPDLAVPGAVETVRSFAKLAVEAGSRGWRCCPAVASPRPNGPSGRWPTPAPS